MAQYQSYFRVTGTAHLRENLPQIIFGQFRIVLKKNRILQCHFRAGEVFTS